MMGRRWLVAAAMLALASAQCEARTARRSQPDAWTGSWASAQMVPDGANELPAADLADATLREIVRLSVGGERVRLRLSNAFGTAPLHIASAHVARAVSPGSAKIDSASDRVVTFAGRSDATIPAGADYWSDPVEIEAPALSSLAVSLYLDAAPARQTSHPGSHATSYLVHGDQTAAADLADARKVEHWYELSGVDVAVRRGGAIVALGDSITDGHGSTTNGNDRWPDALAARLQASRASRAVGVLNVGIGGNRMLLDGLGPNALARFDRDVLGQSQARTVILLEGVNDIGTLTRTAPAAPQAHAALVSNVVGSYRQVIARAHARGLRVIGATVTPFMGSDYYHPEPVSEADRQAINAWIRSKGHFDAVVDFDRTIRDPAHPERMAARYDSGDHLHPSPAGYRAMADSIPLRLAAP